MLPVALILGVLSSIVAVWNLGKHLVRESAEVLATKIAEKMTPQPPPEV